MEPPFPPQITGNLICVGPAKIKGAVTPELRFDTFNVFNRVNLTGVDGNLQDGTFGTVSNTQTPRNMLLGARLTF